MRVHPSEIYLSQTYHQRGIPLLFCPTTLKNLGLNQVDLSRVLKGRIELTEVKSSTFGFQVWLSKMNRNQQRIRRLSYLFCLILINLPIFYNCFVVGAKKESFAKKSNRI